MSGSPSLRPTLPFSVGSMNASPHTGAMLLATDWSGTPLGPMEGWPQSLRIAVSICLNSRFPMFVWWGPELINIYNDAYVPILGQRHPGAFGKPAQQWWHEIWDVVGPQKDAVVLRGEATWNERVLLVMERNGFPEETYFTWSYSPIYEEDGRVEGLFCACTEETGHVRAERERDQLMAQAQDTARTLQTWFDNAPGFIALLNGPHFVFELVNNAYYQLVGHRQILGKPVFEALPETRAQGFDAILCSVYATGEPFIGRELRVQLQKEPDAPPVERYLDLVYQPVRDRDGKVVAIFVQGHDVTDQVLATQALKEADRRKDEFLATLAHELRNPLAPMRQAAALAKRPSAAAQERGWALDIIERQIGQMTLLIDDLLDLSRISRGKLELRRQHADARRLVESALETSSALIRAKDHRLSVTLPDAPVMLDADPLRVSQVVANLLSNAAKYTDPGGRIELTLAEEAGEAVIRVADNGIGLSEADRQKIFTMFSQVSSALSRSEGGLGIGLALSRGLVELHGGRIEALSDGPGRGSVFEVRLPLLAHAADAQPGARQEATVRASARKRILVADDNVDALETLALLLETEGHEVHRALDGEAALAIAFRERPDVAVLDIGMPRLNGYEVASRLRAQMDRAPMLIALTGWGQAQDQARAAESGFDFHCTKPVELPRLLELLQHAAPTGSSA